jgi:polyferredoxin
MHASVAFLRNSEQESAQELPFPTAFARRSQIKKIPSDQRRRRPLYSTEPNPFRRLLWKLQADSQFLRSSVQFSFLLLCFWIGYEFHLFVKWGSSNGAEQFFERPPGVEGFLPISALISLNYWLQTGIINEIHPSGLFIFIAIVALGFAFKKSFCSWMCPVGTVSEALWNAGEKIFGKTFWLPRWADYPLRSLKYLILFFFGYSIAQMDVDSLRQFIYSPYNKVADIKMYLFFAEISSFALWTILILAALSVVIKNFWCRYLCPYGALLGFVSFFSPLKITRQRESCIDCELCTKACPSNIAVHTATRVWSDECTSCLQCVEVCPVKNTLSVQLTAKSKPVQSWVFGVLMAGTFVAITGLAMVTQQWKNGIGREEYQKRFRNLDSPAYQHNRGTVPKYDSHD